MPTFKRTSLPLLLVLLGVFACAMPSITVTDPNANGTAVAQTVDFIMMMTQNAAGEDVVDISSDTPTIVPTLTATWTGEATFTLPPTLTPTATLTSTPTLTPTPWPTLTATFMSPMISVSVPTNCRTGPGRIYDLMGFLPVGMTVQVYARTPDGSYWYIRNPDDAREFCWVWGEYATLTGMTGGVPVFTPPPSPTPTKTATPSPGFTASFSGQDSCPGSGWGRWLDFVLRNTGTMTFKSTNVVVRDTVTGVTISAITDGFTDKTGCSTSEHDTLQPDKKVTVSSPGFSYDPNNHKLRATITLCTQNGLNGTCVTSAFNFTP